MRKTGVDPRVKKHRSFANIWSDGQYFMYFMGD